MSCDPTPGTTTNSASPGSSEQHPLEVLANSQKDLDLSDPLSCGAQRCHGHGACVTRGESVGCECSDGYSGESCQHAGRARSRALTVLAVVFVVLLVAAALMFIKR